MAIKKTLLKAADPGFSLIELLLVMALLPIIFFAVYSNFNAGLNIWARVVRAAPQEDLDIFEIKVRRDIENMLRISMIPFTGEKEEVSFAAAIQARPELGGDRAIGRIRLFYDENARAIVREVADYSTLYREKPGTRNLLLQNISFFEMAFLSKEPLESGYTWSDAWKPEPNKLPVAVKISFALSGIAEKQELIVFIPVGGKFL